MGDQFKAYEGKEPYIFVSYARKDKNRVFPLLKALHEKGYRIWVDEAGIHWGEEWMETIVNHIDRAAVCLVFWSKASAASPHCTAELGEIVAEQKTVVTAFFDETPVRRGLWMYLRQFQAVKLGDLPSDAAFVERLERETVFAPCKDAPGMEIPTKTKVPPKPEVLPKPKVSPKSKTTRKSERRRQLLITALFLIAVSAAAVAAIFWQFVRVKWTLDDKGVLTISGYGYMNNYSSAKKPPWWDRRREILSITIGDGIYSVGTYSFSDCTSLTSVTIPNNVNQIGSFAFSGCTSLKNVTISKGVTRIGSYAFSKCTSLTSITFPDENTKYIEGRNYWVTFDISIAHDAFRGCSNLKSVSIPGLAMYVDSGEHASFPSGTSVYRRKPPTA